MEGNGRSCAPKKSLRVLCHIPQPTPMGRRAALFHAAMFCGAFDQKASYVKKGLCAVIEFHNVSKTYENGTMALKDVSLQIQKGLMTKASCYPEELSGGEQQRVALARALTNNANLIIADEPTGNIDPTMSYEVVKLLTCLNEMGTTIVMVTHEHELVRAFDRRVITLGNGCIVGDTAAQAPQEPDVPQPIEPLSDAVQAGGAL